MASGQIADVYVISDSSAVYRVIVVSKDLDMWQVALNDLVDIGQ